MAAWIYIIRCGDGSYYTGCTTNIEQRWGEHQAGERDGYTATRRPLELVWSEEFQVIHDAIDSERRIKGWSRAKKEALISGNLAALPILSRRGHRPSSS